MRILIIGATGTLGRVLVDTLSSRGHATLQASRHSKYRVDIEDPQSISELFDATGEVDAVACVAGTAPFAPMQDLSYADFRSGLANKLLGQIELVRRGIQSVNDGGSFTLVSGVTSTEPIASGVVLSVVNGAVDAFVRAAAVEIPRGLRVNSVSPSIVAEVVDAYGSAFPGFHPIPAAMVAEAFVKSIEGVQTGQTYRVGY